MEPLPFQPNLPMRSSSSRHGEAGFVDAETSVRLARFAQSEWAAMPLHVRLALMRRARWLIAEHADALAETSARARQRPSVEALSAEVLPLLDACRFLERRASSILAPRRLGISGRPLWLAGVSSEIIREPFGVVLIIAPSNYPLFLPAVQTLQALTAGNAVLWKPGVQGGAVARQFAGLLEAAGLDPRLLQILPEATEPVRNVIAAGVNKVVFTGSAATGTAILNQLAPRAIPATMELSGCDAVFVRADADLDLVVRALKFGLRLNAGQTCIAPRRVFVARSIATELEGRLAEAFKTCPLTPIAAEINQRLLPLFLEAMAQGGHAVVGQVQPEGAMLAPLIMAGVTPTLRLLQEDVFAPVLSLVTVADDHDALVMANRCPFALGATIFSRDPRRAAELAARVNAGVVVINDLIVPTADPRVPFGGRQRSGFGVTRGAEGLLELTQAKVISIRRGRQRPHFDEPGPGEERMFLNYLQLAHGRGLRLRMRAFFQLVRALAAMARTHRRARPHSAQLSTLTQRAKD